LASGQRCLPIDKARALRLFFLCFGWFNVALGVAGALLPLVPTTVFLIVAVGCFARSSPRFADWLYGHVCFGPPLRRWRDERIVPIKAKILATASMATSLAVFHAGYAEYVTAKWLATAICLVAAAYLLSRPHGSRCRETSEPAVPAPEPARSR
jgi:hypothetical protein